MKRGRNSCILGAIALLGIGLLAAAPAVAERDGELATLAAGPAGVSWAPRVAYEEMTLTVAGMGYALSETFRGGQSASFAPVDREGYALPDGTYNWEIRMSQQPHRLDTSAFRNEKMSADGRQMEAARAPRAQVQSGAFTIKNGAIVDSTLVEPASAPARGDLQSAAADIDDTDAAAPRN